MAEIYKTEDGQRFTNQVDAQQHANNLASEAARHKAVAASGDMAYQERLMKTMLSLL